MIALAETSPHDLDSSACGVEQAELHTDQVAPPARAYDLDREPAAGAPDDRGDRNAQGARHALGRDFHLDRCPVEPAGLCWVSSDGDIGPAVGEAAQDLVPVVLAALDRVAKQQEPESVGVFCTTDSWWLLDRLRRLGFRVHWPGWVMSSVPLPGLDRYLATRPARLL